MKPSLSKILGCMLLLTISSTFLYAQAPIISQTGLTGTVQKIIPNASTVTNTIDYVSIAKEIQYWIFALVGIIAFAYIVWIGAKLLWAPGNMEEVSTAMKSLGYIVL